MFTNSDLVLINKIDTLAYFDFDFDKAAERIHRLNPDAVILPISAKTGEGLDRVDAYLRGEISKNKNQKSSK
jgi:hydrogenase nickel incorporation protein HypB